jgi:thioesterase domain-containing protein
MAGEIESELGWVGDGVLTIHEEANAALPPIFAVHGVDGDGIRFAAISRMLTPSRSVYGLRAPARSSGDEFTYEIPNLSARYLEAMRSVQPTGPYVVASYCMGAGIALDIASRLEAEAESTALVLIDPRLRRPTGPRYALWLFPRRLEQRRLTAGIRRRLRRRSVPEPDLDNATVWYALEAAREAYLPVPTSTPAALLKSRDFAKFEMPDWYLRRVFRHVVVEENVPSEHVNLFQQPNIVALSLAIGRALSLLAGSED